MCNISLIPERRPDPVKVLRNQGKTESDQKALWRLQEQYNDLMAVYREKKFPKWLRGMHKTWARQHIRRNRHFFNRIDREYTHIMSGKTGRMYLELIPTCENDPRY